MTALDVNSAVRSFVAPDAAFTTIPFGDVNIGTSDGDPQDVSTVMGRGGQVQVIPMGNGDKTLYTDDFVLPSEFALFVAVHNIAGASYFEPAYNYEADVDFVLSATDVDYLTYPTGGTVTPRPSVEWPGTYPEGITVVCLTANATEGRFLASPFGTVHVRAQSQVVTTEPGRFECYPDYVDVALAGMWLFAGAVDETTAIDTMQAILDEVDPEGSGVDMLEATGGWPIVGTIDEIIELVEGETPESMPVIPPVTKGGTQTPPPLPEYVPKVKPTPVPPPSDPPEYDVPVDADDGLIFHVADTYPSPDLDEYGQPIDWQPTVVKDQPYGYLQIVVNGVDVTDVDGTPCSFPQYSDVEPFGFQAASFEVAGITLHTAKPAWATKNAHVVIRFKRYSGGYDVAFRGVLFDSGISDETGLYTVSAIGIAFSGDYQLRLPPLRSAREDIGTVIARLMNGVVARRFDAMTAVLTGIIANQTGGWETLLTGYITRLLATARDKDGRHWTVHMDETTPVLEPKDLDTVHFRFRAGQPGVTPNLNSDTSDQTNVVYAEGITKDGGGWSHKHYPFWNFDETPQYPFANPANTIRIGTRDSDTTTGTGVSDAQRRMRRPITRRWSVSDSAALERLQDKAGIQVDGLLGPQSWAMLWNTGSNTGTLDGAIILPLAAAPETQPYLYGPDGERLGKNPKFDPDVIPIWEYVNYGRGVEKATAIRDAELRVQRDSVDGLYGTIVLETDPSEMPRYLIRAGMNMVLQDLHGEDVKFHIAAVDHGELTSTLTVDTKARDYPMLEAILERDRNAVDPAKAALKRLTSGSLSTDRATYDSESPAGHIPPHAIFTNLWDVIPVPMSEFGNAVRAEFFTTGPYARFCVGVFRRKVTHEQILQAMGGLNPLTSDENPWQTEALDDLGLLMGWGDKRQPLGYWPKQYTDADNPLASGGTGAPLTGKFVDDGSWPYKADDGVVLYVATLADRATHIFGRIYGEYA